MSREGLQSLGYTDRQLCDAARDAHVEGVPDSFGTDAGSQLRRLIFLRYLRAVTS